MHRCKHRCKHRWSERFLLLLSMIFILMGCSLACAQEDAEPIPTPDRVIIEFTHSTRKPSSTPTAAPSSTRTTTKQTPRPAVTAAPVTTIPSYPDAQTTVDRDEYLHYSNPASTVSEDQLTISFVGDLSIGDAQRYIRNQSSLTQCIYAKGETWLFETVSDYFHTDDFTLGNLEVVLTDRTSPLYPAKAYNMLGDPGFAQVLRLGGIDGLNTVNNHCVDFRYGGYEDTLSNLEAEGLLHFGSLNPTRDTNRYVTLGRLEIKGVRIGMIGFTYPTNANLELIYEDIRTLREEGCQIVIVSLHWGREEHTSPNASQFPYAQSILDAGADMIWGHHPHVLQPVYFYEGKPVFFSTGNFVFGTIKTLDPASGIFQLTWDILEDGSVKLHHFHMIPTQVRHSKQEYRPLVLTQPDTMSACLRHVIGKTDRYGFLKLPDGFAETGTVYILEDGSLTLEEP